MGKRKRPRSFEIKGITGKPKPTPLCPEEKEAGDGIRIIRGGTELFPTVTKSVTWPSATPEQLREILDEICEGTDVVRQLSEMAQESAKLLQRNGIKVDPSSNPYRAKLNPETALALDLHTRCVTAIEAIKAGKIRDAVYYGMMAERARIKLVLYHREADARSGRKSNKGGKLGRETQMQARVGRTTLALARWAWDSEAVLSNPTDRRDFHRKLALERWGRFPQETIKSCATWVRNQLRNKHGFSDEAMRGSSVDNIRKQIADLKPGREPEE